jgi:hypothetical protein
VAPRDSVIRKTIRIGAQCVGRACAVTRLIVVEPLLRTLVRYIPGAATWHARVQDKIRPRDWIARVIGENPIECPVSECRIQHWVLEVTETLAPAEWHVPNTAERNALRFVMVVQLMNERFIDVPVIQPMIRFKSLGESVGKHPGEIALAVGLQPLLELQGKCIVTVISPLSQVVCDVPELRIRPEQIKRTGLSAPT